MARSLFGSVSIIFLLAFVVIVQGRDVGVGRICESQSFSYNGTCNSGKKCPAACQSEGFESGHCVGGFILRRCWCIKPCFGNPVGSGPLIFASPFGGAFPSSPDLGFPGPPGTGYPGGPGIGGGAGGTGPQYTPEEKK